MKLYISLLLVYYHINTVRCIRELTLKIKVPENTLDNCIIKLKQALFNNNKINMLQYIVLQ